MIIHGDSLDILKTLADNSIDSIVTDPPYGLSFMENKWDYDVPSNELWQECLRVLKPGGHVLSFSSARTYHRMTVNIEEAGFEIRDQIMWLYASGMPKGIDVSKAIDKKLGKERRVIGTERQRGRTKLSEGKHALGDFKGEWHVTEPNSEEAQKYNGWHTTLKPCHEPICVARKPFKTSVAENVLEHGTGALNVGKCKVGTETITTSAKTPDNSPFTNFGRTGWAGCQKSTHQGRWPANVILSEDHEHESWAKFFYCPKASPHERGTNNHPTLKPLALMRYLVRLVTPEGGTVLDPFVGSGTTALAAQLEGFECVGIEREAEYVAVARARVEGCRRLIRAAS